MEHSRPGPYSHGRWMSHLVAVSALLCLLIPSAASMVLADDSGSTSFVSSPSDGHLRLNGNDGWPQLRDSSEAAEVFDSLRYVKVNTRPDIIYRGFLFFDTSSLPDSVDISAARLHIYAKCTGDLDDTHLYILGGNEEYPHDPLVPEDFAIPFGSLPVCAHVDTGEWADGLAYRTVSLENARQVVDTGGTTKLCLLERRDFENATPRDLKSENELKLFSYEEGEGYQPYLEVFWGEVPQETMQGDNHDGDPTRGVPTGPMAVVGVLLLLAAGIWWERQRRIRSHPGTTR